MIKILTLIGILIGFIGSFLMYYFGPKVSSQTILYKREELESFRKRDKKNNDLVRIGMLLLVISFLFQLVALLLPQNE